ncbi:hypothetical protein VTL71DRAFT_15846 [Oculimacula yallundae]|uniref:Uncharacterized protein n=1 Tax=Oculimacula yallundae TaxID=86028 RepID=A0ABR4CDC6_9HELO
MNPFNALILSIHFKTFPYGSNEMSPIGASAIYRKTATSANLERPFSTFHAVLVRGWRCRGSQAIKLTAETLDSPRSKHAKLHPAVCKSKTVDDSGLFDNVHRPISALGMFASEVDKDAGRVDEGVLTVDEGWDFAFGIDGKKGRISLLLFHEIQIGDLEILSN